MGMRFLPTNLIESLGTVTVNSVASGEVSNGFKQGTGVATMESGGTYTGTAQLTYKVQIDSIAAGAEITQATFKWSDDGGATWDASAVATDTAWVTLNNGVQVRWTAAVGADFAVGDYWTFVADAPFGISKLTDLDRDNRYRSGGLAAPEFIKVDLGSAKQITCLIIQDHNFSAAATITLQAHTADAWGAPDESDVLVWNSGIIVAFFDYTKRWWRLTVTDAANTDGYISVGELFLGTYTELTRVLSAGQRWGYNIITDKKQLEHGAQSVLGKNLGWRFNFRFHQCESADYVKVKALLDAIYNTSTREFKPYYFCPASGTPNETYLIETEGLEVTPEILSRKTLMWSGIEVLKSTTD